MNRIQSGSSQINSEKNQAHKEKGVGDSLPSRSPTAWFVNNPRVVTALLKPHRLEEERAFTIVYIVRLSEMDYENFCTDMLVDRSYIEEHANLCFEEGLLHDKTQK